MTGSLENVGEVVEKKFRLIDDQIAESFFVYAVATQFAEAHRSVDSSRWATECLRPFSTRVPLFVLVLAAHLAALLGMSCNRSPSQR